MHMGGTFQFISAISPRFVLISQLEAMLFISDPSLGRSRLEMLFGGGDGAAARKNISFSAFAPNLSKGKSKKSVTVTDHHGDAEAESLY